MLDQPQDKILPILMQAMEQAPMPLLITDLHGNILYANRAFSQNTGYSPEEFLGKNPRILQSGVTPKNFYKEMWSSILSGRPWKGALCNKNKKGAIYWESLSITPLKDEQGKIKYFFGIWEDVTERKADEAFQQRRLRALEKESITDSLTGLYNHKHILGELEKEIERSIRYKRVLSGMMIDIDNLKSINDQFGHIAGDHVLETMTAALRASIRKVDILGRYGEDEFLLILPEASAENAEIVARRILKSIASLRFNFQNTNTGITVSIGLLSLDNLDHIDRVILVEKIDRLLYKAKHAGKNQIVSE